MFHCINKIEKLSISIISQTSISEFKLSSFIYTERPLFIRSPLKGMCAFDAMAKTCMYVKLYVAYLNRTAANERILIR